MSCKTEDDAVLFEYSNVQNKIENIKGIKFHSNHVYDEKYIKANVKEFNGVVNTNVLGNEVPKKGVYYTGIAWISIDSVMKTDKKIIHKFIQKNFSKK